MDSKDLDLEQQEQHLRDEHVSVELTDEELGRVSGGLLGIDGTHN